MTTDFNHDDYGRRWQAETVMFMLKTRQGDRRYLPAQWVDNFVPVRQYHPIGCVGLNGEMK